MIYQDAPSSSSEPKVQPNPVFRIPPIADRLLAFAFDLVLFSPVFSFILASLLRRLELQYFTSPTSTEFFVLCGVLGVFILLLTVLFQTLFLLLMGATPGKYFFKIQVVSLQGPLRFSQCLLRSTIWVFEFAAFAIPFLEILSEAKRRPLHDRAAGTMAVTLKKQGDLGPQPFETKMLRHFFIAASLSAIVWVIFSVGHFYKMAVRGDFKKSELEADNYLCSSVSNSVKDGEQRLDKALALYLADEISELCLASEADFVLWSQNDDEKPWAYLAKGYLQKGNDDQFEAYLERTCQTDEESVACQIAQFEADPSAHALPAESVTASILKVTQDFEKGLYKDSETQFLKLSHDPSFQTFAQQGLVKSYWAQNKVERAQGAYQSVVHQMTDSSKKELSAWICHEELDKQCTQQAIEACENLKAVIRKEPNPVKETFVAVALIREKECRQTSSLEYSKFHSVLEEREDVLKYVRAISKEVVLPNDEKSKILKDLAFRKQSVRPLFLRRLALQEWLEHMKSEDDFQTISKFLKDKKVRDLSWIKVYDRALQNLIRAKATKALKEIVDLPSEELITNYKLQTLQIQAQFVAQNYQKAWVALQKYQKSDRAPASATSNNSLDLKQIRQELEKNLSLQGAHQ